MNSKLQAYLNRIGFTGTPRPDLETLMALHRAHLLSTPYENLDIHQGCPLTVDEDAIYEKIVSNRRGGWCFEMNGLLAWALKTIGFEVTLLATTVARGQTDYLVEGNHLVLLVQLDRPYLADVGFGNGLFEPIPLATGIYEQGFLAYRLSHDGERWWFENHIYGGAGFDFMLDGHQLSDFAPQSHELQTSPESGFVRTTVCYRHTLDGFRALRGAILSHYTREGVQQQTIESAADYQQVLADLFDLHFDDVSALWEKVWARHLAWMKEQSMNSST